jgi:tetratricopeptide (TPR) repeat protein
MEGKGISKYVVGLFTSLFLLLFLQAKPQNSYELQCCFKELFIRGDMRTWKTVVDSLRRCKLDDASEMVLLQAEYGLIGNLIGTDQDAAAKTEINRFEKHLQRMLKQQPANATLHAYRAALVGFQINFQIWRAPILGPDNGRWVDSANKWRKNEPLPLVEKGNSLYFRPAFVGGNKKEAIKLYEKAFEIYSDDKACNWMYYSIGTWLGQAYVKQGNKTKAEQIYLKLLETAPDYLWVKNELLPKVKSGESSRWGKFTFD